MDRVLTLQGVLDEAYHEYADDPKTAPVVGMLTAHIAKRLAEWMSLEVEGLDTYEIEGDMGDVLVYRGDVMRIIYGGEGV